MTVDRTDPYDLREWLQDRYQRIGFRDDFLTATKGMRPATEAQYDWHLAQGLEEVIEFAAGRVKGRGRPWKRMKRVVVAWCISEGWWPHDHYIVDATADVQLWFSRARCDAGPRVIRQVALDVARARQELAEGGTTFELNSDRWRRSLPENPHAECFNLVDDQGVSWRIWSSEYQGLAMIRDETTEVIVPQVEQTAGALQIQDQHPHERSRGKLSVVGPSVIDLGNWREAKADRVASLRSWARGELAIEATVELLIRTHRGQLLDEPWVCCDEDGRYWFDVDLAADHASYVSGEASRVLPIAVSLASGNHPLDLRDAISGLDPETLQLVLAALAHAGGATSALRDLPYNN